MKSSMLLSLAGWLFVVCYSCTKPVSLLNDPSLTLSGKQAIMTAGSFRPFNSGGGDYLPPAGNDEDTAETPTILGPRLTNPYSLDNMTMAYNIVHSTQISRLTPTNLYVRFLPADIDQLETLADSMDLDLFDTPMDYSIVQDGDYYQDPSIPAGQITWQYAVVQPGFQFPPGITHEILDSIYIPANSDYEVEDMAFQLAGDPDINTPPQAPMTAVVPYTTPSGSVTPQVLKCPPGYEWNWTLMKCVTAATDCPPGKHWDPTINRCVSDNPTPPPPPPGPGSHYPAGHLYVYDTNLDDAAHPDHKDPLRHVRIVVKRWFKIQRLYTDNNGYFESTKRFHRKAKVIVKFKNDYSTIRSALTVRFWEMIFQLKKKLGTYSGTLNDIDYTFKRAANKTEALGNRFWVAATINNAVQEHRDYANQLGFAAPPLHLNIYITPWGFLNGLASTPLFGKRYVHNLPLSFVNTFLIGRAALPATPVAAFIAVVMRTNLDMAIDYHYDDMSRFTSDAIKETVYHELSHASDYSRVGNSWYTDFVQAELAESEAHPLPSDALNPYGSSTSSHAPIIALGEAWAYFMGHYLADRHYGTTAICQIEQKGGNSFCNSGYTGHPHIDVLEYFDPSLSSDPFHWIPKGLIYDLMDDTNETILTGGPIDDNVSGFTIQQLFNPLQSNVNTLQQYRARLQQQNTGNQTTQVTNLFAEYGY